MLELMRVSEAKIQFSEPQKLLFLLSQNTSVGVLIENKNNQVVFLLMLLMLNNFLKKIAEILPGKF